jgi:AraC family transcriptional regulator
MYNEFKKLYSCSPNEWRNSKYKNHKPSEYELKEVNFSKEEEFNIKEPTIMAIHHSNPNITDIEEYRYIACVDLKDNKIESKSDIGLGCIKSGLYATIRFLGICEDALTLLFPNLFYNSESNKYNILGKSICLTEL